MSNPCSITITTATLSQLDDVTQLEAQCFPPAEAASRSSFEWRLATYGSHFHVLKIGEQIVAFVNGPVTKERDLADEMYDSPAFHTEQGEWQMIFGVVTHPQWQHRGYATKVMKHFIEHARQQHRRGVVLTCKEHMIGFYQRFGFADEGISSSVHGGVPWHQMRLTF